MSDEQEDSHSLVGWIIGVAVTLAVAVAVLLGIMSAVESDSSNSAASSTPSSTATSTATSASTQSSTSAAVATPNPAKVYFEVNSFSTPENTGKLLSELVGYSKGSPNAKLSISGFHDKTGDATKNQELAKNRAKMVKELLLSAGVPEDRILMQKPTETTGAGNDKEARRVEVSAAQ